MLKPPTPATLKRYGLSNDEWWSICASQGYRCPLCERKLSGLKTVVDHEHVKGWRKLPPDERKQFVRGVIDIRCNYLFLTRGMTALIASNMADYLDAYENGRT